MLARSSQLYAAVTSSFPFASLPHLPLYLHLNWHVRQPQGAGSEGVVAGICRLLGFFHSRTIPLTSSCRRCDKVTCRSGVLHCAACAVRALSWKTMFCASLNEAPHVTCVPVCRVTEVNPDSGEKGYDDNPQVHPSSYTCEKHGKYHQRSCSVYFAGELAPDPGTPRLQGFQGRRGEIRSIVAH